MNVPKLSIIVPVYNAAPYLHRCIDSILSQSFCDYELLLIDDGSTDGSGKICDEYADVDTRIKVFHKENGGVSSARNLGLDEAQGEWISFIDADDTVTQEYLHVIFEKGMETDLTFFSNNVYYEGNAYIPRCLSDGQFYTNNDREKTICRLKQNDESYEYFGYTWNKVFRSSIVKENHIRFVEGLFLREDELFTAEYCQHISSLMTISDVIYNYYQSMSGLTGKNKNRWQYKTFADGLMRYSEQWSNEKLLRIDITRCVLAMFAVINSEDKFLSLYYDIKQLRSFVSSHERNIDFSQLSNKQEYFLRGKSFQFIFRKAIRCFKTKHICQNS